MDLRYTHNRQTVAEGERAMVLLNGRLYVRTAMLGTDLSNPDMLTVTYRLREVFDAATPAPEPVNHPPVAGTGTLTIVLEPKP